MRRTDGKKIALEDEEVSRILRNYNSELTKLTKGAVVMFSGDGISFEQRYFPLISVNSLNKLFVPQFSEVLSKVSLSKEFVLAFERENYPGISEIELIEKPYLKLYENSPDRFKQVKDRVENLFSQTRREIISAYEQSFNLGSVRRSGEIISALNERRSDIAKGGDFDEGEMNRLVTESINTMPESQHQRKISKLVENLRATLESVLSEVLTPEEIKSFTD